MSYKKPSFPKTYLPSKDEVKKYHLAWESLDNYRDHEKALSLLFRNPDSSFFKNDEITKVIIKVSALNDFYSTNLYRVHDVALKIITIKDFDLRLQNRDISLVDELRYVTFKTYKIPDDSDKGIWKEVKKDIYSFATKYCSHHQPDKFPIYDKYVDEVITKLKKQYPQFFNFKIFDSFNTSIPIEERK